MEGLISWYSHSLSGWLAHDSGYVPPGNASNVFFDQCAEKHISHFWRHHIQGWINRGYSSGGKQYLVTHYSHKVDPLDMGYKFGHILPVSGPIPGQESVLVRGESDNQANISPTGQAPSQGYDSGYSSVPPPSSRRQGPRRHLA